VGRAHQSGGSGVLRRYVGCFADKPCFTVDFEPRGIYRRALVPGEPGEPLATYPHGEELPAEPEPTVDERRLALDNTYNHVILAVKR